MNAGAHPQLERGVHQTAMACIERWYAREANGGQTGSVTATQRFGSALQLNLPFHVIFLDGCYAQDPRGNPRPQGTRRCGACRPRWHDGCRSSGVLQTVQ